MKKLYIIQFLVLLIILTTISGCSRTLKRVDTSTVTISTDSYYEMLEKLSDIENTLDGNDDFSVLFDFFEETRGMFPNEDYYYQIYGHFEDYFIAVFHAVENANYVRNILEDAYSKSDY